MSSIFPNYHTTIAGCRVNYKTALFGFVYCLSFVPVARYFGLYMAHAVKYRTMCINNNFYFFY